MYLDVHGLAFETSICYWQDQPGITPYSRKRKHHVMDAKAVANARHTSESHALLLIAPLHRAFTHRYDLRSYHPFSMVLTKARMAGYALTLCSGATAPVFYRM